MAALNRTEIAATIAADFIPTLTLAQHKAALNKIVTDSAVLTKEVRATVIPVAGVATVNFALMDTADITTGAVPLTIYQTGLEQGQIGYIQVFKSLATSISFNGITNVTPNQSTIDSLSPFMLYQITNKGGTIYAMAMRPVLDGAWSDLTPVYGWTATEAKYRILADGRVEIFLLGVDGTAAIPGTFCALPSAIDPTYKISQGIFKNSSSPIGSIQLLSDGRLVIFGLTDIGYYANFTYHVNVPT